MAEDSLKSPAQEMKKVYIVETLWGEKSWELWADRLEERSDTTWVFELSIGFYSDRKQVSTLFADSGVVFKNKDLKAFGRVRVETDEGSVLTTETLRWDNEERLIETDDPVTIEKGGKVIRGMGLVSDPNLEHITIRGEIEGSGK